MRYILDWNRLIKFKQDQIIGLDIGSSAVKLVQLHKNGAAYAVTAADMVAIADDAETARAKEMNTIRAILDCLRYTAVQTPFAVCGVCGPEVAVRYFKFPPMAQEEIPGAVALEAAQVCPFSIDDNAVDYRLVPNGENALSGIFVAATNKLMERKTRLVRDASLNCVLMDVDGLAVLNCFSECEKIENGQVNVILNVGSTYATLVIMNGNNLPFVRDIAYAGGDIIAQIAAERGLSPQVVGEIFACGENASRPQADLTDSLTRACQKLITDVADTLRYYMAQEKAAAIEKIFLCGGFALTKGFPELLAARLPAKVVLWNPFEKMTCHAGKRTEDMLGKNGPAMVVAAGLAMRSI
jgi:type IV pilus assembly protein PilM